MKKVRAGFEDAPRPDVGEEDASEHERNRRIKSEQERLLRKQLSRLRVADAGEEELDDESPRRSKA